MHPYQTPHQASRWASHQPAGQDAATLEAKRQRMARQIERRRQALILGPTPWGVFVCFTPYEVYTLEI